METPAVGAHPGLRRRLAGPFPGGEKQARDLRLSALVFHRRLQNDRDDDCGQDGRGGGEMQKVITRATFAICTLSIGVDFPEGSFSDSALNLSYAYSASLSCEPNLFIPKFGAYQNAEVIIAGKSARLE